MTVGDLNEELVQATAEKLNSEFRRGALVLAVLSRLQQEHYGYSLRQALAEAGLAVEEGTLYPLIRRLEKQGLLLSEWREEAGRRKRFYRLAPLGEAVLVELRQSWNSLNASVAALVGDTPKEAK